MGSVAFALALGPNNVHTGISFKPNFRVLGTSKWIFPLETQYQLFYDHNTFSIHSIGKKLIIIY